MAGFGDRLLRARFWSYATVFGALWGAIEVTLGSFLHSIRAPFSGALLGGIGAMLLIAERQLLPARGLTLATGVVAALCKSVSPGGVIWGPMVGITLEALAVEVVLLARPRSPVTALTAGAAAVTVPLVHHVLSMWLRYGGDVLLLYVRVLEKAGATLGLTARQGAGALAAAALIITGLGAFGGALGHRIGQRAARVLEEEDL